MNYSSLILQKNYYLYILFFLYRLNTLYLSWTKTMSKSSSINLHRKWIHVSTFNNLKTILQSSTNRWNSKLYNLTVSDSVGTRMLFITTINININRQLSKCLIIPTCNSRQTSIYRLWFWTQIKYYDYLHYQTLMTFIHFTNINFLQLQKTIKTIQQNPTSLENLHLTSFTHNLKFL